jgi:hypothetical protein
VTGAFVATGTVVVGTGTVVVGTVVVGGVVVVVTTAAAAHVGTVMVLSLSVTAPVWARRRPSTLAPVFSVTDVSARMVPTNDVVVPRVAELPTCQKTLHACAPPSRTTELLEAVMRVDPAWKMKTEFGSPPPFNVTVPFSAKALADF